MKVPLTVVDHLRRAEQVYGHRIAFVDERRADRGNAFWVDILVTKSEVVVIGRSPVAIQGSVVFWRFKRVGILQIDR